MTGTAEQTSSPTAEQHSMLRGVLIADKEATESLIARLIDDLDSFTDARKDGATDDEHDPEGPTLAFEQSQSSALLRQASTRLHEIEDALARLDLGTYGICARCHTPISYGRLGARPYAQHCISCAEKVGS